MNFKFKDFCLITKIDNFLERKSRVLSCIDNIGQWGVKTLGQNISNTDFLLDKSRYNSKHNYMLHLIDSFNEHLQRLNDEFVFTDFSIANYWYQQYEYGGFHTWHIHDNVTFTNIAYIELPGNNICTKVRFKNEIIEIPVQEGEILSFPGFFTHCSPPNTGNRKTVVVLNSLHNV